MTNSVIKISNFVHYFYREGGYLDCDQFSLLHFSLFMGGGRVQREIVQNSLYSLLFYFELFPKQYFVRNQRYQLRQTAIHKSKSQTFRINILAGK